MTIDNLAHIAGDGREQTVLEHLEGTATLAQEFASAFGAAPLGYLAGISHDIGKYSAAFQKRIRENSAKVDHSTAGALECMKLRQLSAALAVAGHHGGLPDWGSQMDSETTFCGRINKARAGKLPDYSFWTQEVTLPAIQPKMLPDAREEMFFTRMLYSCLVDADYLDTEAFMEHRTRERHPADWDLLWDRLQAHIAPWFPPKNPLNEKRCAILNRCMTEGAHRPAGLYTLTVPTGGGKTAASLAFALAHAKKLGMERVIYVIPYTSIIEQTADVFRTMIGEENVLEHHSGVLSDEGVPALATENWDMPVIVTTAVQFFESLYSNRSSKCRKLHSIAKSVVIFDEAQMMPLPYLRPCVFAIAQLVKHFGASAVLCTATQPALGPIFRDYLPQRAIELCPSECCDWDSFRRVTFTQAGTLSWEAVADRMEAQKQVLCIVNSRKSAQTLFELLPEEGRFHLSTLMCPNHRRCQLETIRQRLKHGKTCRVVSTSLIEAGVDVDFPSVLRELAGLDSILQAAGRCNREGKLLAQAAIVTIFKSETPPPRMFRTAVGVTEGILESHADLNGRDTIHRYFRSLLSAKGDASLDQQQLMPMMMDTPFPFRTVSERFHLIESDTKTVYIPQNAEARELIEELRNGKHSRKLFRKLGQYGVNVYEQHFASLPLVLLPDGSGMLMDMTLYSSATGLSLSNEGGRGLFL